MELLGRDIDWWMYIHRQQHSSKRSVNVVHCFATNGGQLCTLTVCVSKRLLKPYLRSTNSSFFGLGPRRNGVICFPSWPHKIVIVVVVVVAFIVVFRFTASKVNNFITSISNLDPHLSWWSSDDTSSRSPSRSPSPTGGSGCSVGTGSSCLLNGVVRTITLVYVSRT